MANFKFKTGTVVQPITSNNHHKQKPTLIPHNIVSTMLRSRNKARTDAGSSAPSNAMLSKGELKNGTRSNSNRRILVSITCGVVLLVLYINIIGTKMPMKTLQTYLASLLDPSKSGDTLKAIDDNSLLAPSESEEENTKAAAENKNLSKKKLGDGCYHVFLDVGSNVGVHGRFLFEPEKYPNANIAHGIFDEHFGSPDTRVNKDICVFTFEPNPAHKERQLQLHTAYDKMGWRYYPLAVGVGDKVGHITFYHQDGGANNEWGFGAFPRRGRENGAVNVTSIRLSSWLTEHIEDRIIPQRSSNLRKDAKFDEHMPTVIMKYDVEGMEYELLPDLLTTRSLCRTVDYAFGEIHPFKVDGRQRRNLNKVLNNFSLHPDKNCKTKKIDTIDDETYHMDEEPLPGELEEKK